MKGQSKKWSMIEVTSNMTIGFIIAWLTTILILPLFGFDTCTASKSFLITLIFTIISLARNYVFRRVFNMIHTKQQETRCS